jgi:nucleoside-diphosphate-sugar epimerase
MAPADSNNNKVCVMDASGPLGSALVHRLLRRGYSVHAALQHHHGELEEMLSIGEKNRLTVFNTDPLDYHSIMDALKGCSGLFYSFEPPSDQPNYDEFMVDLEVRAAHNVLEACAQTETMEKVVFTSSATAVVWSNRVDSSSSRSDDDIDERNWSDINFCKKFKLWQGLSKTVAEKTAWALAMDRGVNMVTINGGLLMSPHLSITNPYLKGAAEMYEDGVFVTADLRFIVDAHICVFEDVSSYGRYLCFNRVINSSEDAVKLAHMLLPSSPPQSVEEGKVYQQRISNKKLNKLMVNYDTELQ